MRARLELKAPCPGRQQLHYREANPEQAYRIYKDGMLWKGEGDKEVGCSNLSRSPYIMTRTGPSHEHPGIYGRWQCAEGRAPESPGLDSRRTQCVSHSTGFQAQIELCPSIFSQRKGGENRISRDSTRSLSSQDAAM